MTDKPQRTAILVTGASGFVGRNFIKAVVREDFYIYAIARRSQKDADVPMHSNIQWIRADLAVPESIAAITDDIAAAGGVDFIFHFAGYYDFTNRDNVEYQRTNVDGTRYLLENVSKLGIKRFIFASSLVVTDFLGQERVLTEESPPDADLPYARSKKMAEELISSYSAHFPCTIVRLAAIFSDWCEYGPLYVLLRNWLSGGWKARLIPGRGETALPYLHVTDLNNLLLRVVARHDRLSRLDFLLASPDGCVSQKELFEIAVRYSYGHSLRLCHVPVTLAALGVAAMQFGGWLTGNPPFERVWMLRYTDRRMQVDAAATRLKLDWQPIPRYHITRRMLFLIENMKSQPQQWEVRNLAMARKVFEERPGLAIYEAMLACEAQVVAEHISYLLDPANLDLFPNYQQLDPEVLKIRLECTNEMLQVAVLKGDRKHILCYTNYLARQRYKEGMPLRELCAALTHNAQTTIDVLSRQPALARFHQRIHDEIGMTMQLILDEVEDVYETMARGKCS